MDRNWAANIAGNLGLTAGKLYLNGQLLAPEDVDDNFVCSGFCFEEHFFITTRHFLPLGPEALEKMSSAEHAKHIAKISTTRYSPDADGARESRSAYLAYESLEFDIAIFVLSDNEPRWPTYVRLSQLLATDSKDYFPFFAAQRAFSVGYAIDEDYRYLEYWQKLFLTQQNNPVLESLKGAQPPDFRSIYHPCERILVLGQLDHVQQNPSAWKHSIPGWFGMSGSLVGMLKGNTGQGANVDVHIIGLYKSGEPEGPENCLVPFTTALIGIIYNVCSRLCSGQNN